MKLDLDKFYNSNWKAFVHKEAVEEALKHVPELELKDVEIDTILSITFSVDEYGENPMYIEYLDKEGKKHIVRICPAVTEEINEILTKYETKEEHQADVDNIYNYFTTLNVPMEVQSDTPLNDESTNKVTLNNDNGSIIFKINPETHGEIETLTIHNKNDEFGERPIYVVRFTDFARADEVPSDTEFSEAIKQLENKIHTGDETTLQEAKNYANAQDTTQRNEIITLMNQGDEDTKSEILSVIDVKHDDLKSYVDSKDTEYFETGKRYTDSAKQEAIDESKNYTNTKHNEALAVIEPCQQKLSNIWQSHKAPFIYWLPNIDINTMKLENTENDVKVTLNDGDIVYWRKNAYQPVDLTNYYTKTESDSKFATETELSTNIANITGKLSQIPNTGKVSYINWYPDINIDYVRLVKDGECLRAHINDENSPSGETIGYISTYKPAKESEVSDAFSALVAGDNRTLGDAKEYTNSRVNDAFSTLVAGDNQTLEDAKAYTDTQLTNYETKIENTNKVYGYDNANDTWSKCDGNFTVFHDNSNISKLGYRQTTAGVEKTIDFNNFATKLDSLIFRGTIGARNPSLNNLEQGFYLVYFNNENSDASYPDDMQGQLRQWATILQLGHSNGLCSQIMIRIPSDTMYMRTHHINGWNSWHVVKAPLSNVETGMLNLETVEAVAQEQNAINVENVSVSLQQKTRTMREVKNNSTLTNTKDFLILNLDFSFIPNVLPTSVETTFTENILIDAPEFNGKSFNVTFKANEHKVSSKGVLGEPLSIKTPAFPTSETIKNIEVIVKDKIIIRKENE